MMRLAIYLCAIALNPLASALTFGSTRQHHAISPTVCQTRRDLLVGATLASLVGASTPAPAMAEEAPSPPLVTAIATLDLSIARGAPTPLRIELFGAAAPASVEFFTGLASGTVKAKCPIDDGNANLDVLEDCQENEGVDVGFKGSQLWRLVPDKRIDFGRVDSMFASRIPPTFADDSGSAGALGGIRASSRGAVSIKRGGGAFEFTVAPAYNPALDKEDLIVVGRVAESDLAFLDTINAIPSRRDIVAIGDVPPLGSKFSRACNFTSPDTTCAQYKPLKKIVVIDSFVTSVR